MCEGEEGSATRPRKPDSCRGGGLLGTETRDAVAAEKASLAIRQAGDHHPERAHPRPDAPAASAGRSPPSPLACRLRARRPPTRKERTHLTCTRPAPCPTPTQAESYRPIVFAPAAEIPHPTTSARLRQPSAISVGRPRARLLLGQTGRLLLGQTGLYVCGAWAHAQTPSSLLLFGVSPPPSRHRLRLLLLLSPAVAPPPPPELGRWSRLSRCRERLGDTGESEKSTSNNHHSPLPARRPPSSPTRSPAPFADTDQPHLSFL